MPTFIDTTDVQKLSDVSIRMTQDQAKHLYLLLIHEIRELQDTTRTTDHDLYEKRIAFNHRISDKLRKQLQLS